MTKDMIQTKGITKAELNKRLDEFGKNFNASLDSLKKACEIYAETIRMDFSTAVKFHERFEFISQVTWDKMNLVGNGVVDVQLLVLSDKIASKIAKLPADEQRRILEKPFTIHKARIIHDPHKKCSTIKDNKIKKLVKDMTDGEFARVFDPDMKVRTKEDQIKLKLTKTVPIPVYEVNGRLLQVNRKCVFTREQLVKIISDMR